ncbi:hypothetical protein NGM10_09795 [Halorussus salilacus]|uniref:hypothetical protein n=1 Tax=Halorussus salilacus TaxID=2953750 RepID=UPI00209DFA2B|nr:hypothetical protein [Halorussus salilacus]USZ67021.1 hypothetical protein NGM10_09795 [Halorussus salilacus]
MQAAKRLSRAFLTSTHQMSTNGYDCIGILVDDEQPVFSTVAERLRNAGNRVRFLDPRSELPSSRVDDLSLIVNKQVFPVTLPALRYARRTETAVWNNVTATVALSSRLVGLNALEAVGFRTPPVTFEKPDGEYVAKDWHVWDGAPELNGEGDFYQELIPTEPVDYKYYAVSDGERTWTAGRRVTSKLYGPKRFLGRARTRPALASRLRRLVERLDLRGVGVDFIRDHEDRFWAVDVNLAAGYRDTGLETALFESIRASLPDRYSDE